ncbi:MAG: ankyrin repeat domain-containing protein [Planctomycetota bacterium]|nr:ankyrin repeat domain-containing protein [Planctomycetota bacterium]
MTSEERIARIADGRTDLVFDHLAEGGAVEAVDGDGIALMRWCAYYGDVSAVRRLLEAGGSLDALGPNYDLNGAAFHGQWQLCQFLLEQGADPNRPLPDTGEVPLHAAASKRGGTRYDHVLRVLLDHGADPNRTTEPGVETGSFMRDIRTCGETPLHRAAGYGSLRGIQSLIEAGADREAKDAHGDTPLSWASRAPRSAPVLRELCYGSHRIHAEFEGLETALIGKPHR